MLYALNWFVNFSLLALWSLAAWAANAVAVWTASNAVALTSAASGAVSGAVSSATPGIQDLLGLAWLAPWVPPEVKQAVASMLSGLAPVVESLLQTAPALAGGLTVAVWVIWGLGSALLVLLGAGLHLLIALWRRHGSGYGHQPGRQVAA